MIRLGVCLDSLATLREAGRGRNPDLLAAAHTALIGGADHLVVPLRADRRGVKERDVRLLREHVDAPLTLEIAATAAMCAFATELRPATVCLAPERGPGPAGDVGLDVASAGAELRRVVEELKAAGVRACLSVAPDEAALVAANDVGADAVELHAGRYAAATTEGERVREYLALSRAATTARELGMRVMAGHGLDYANVSRVAALSDVEEVNVGFAIVARSVFTGLERAVGEMRDRVVRARSEEAPIP